MISIIVPVYKVEPYLPRCLESIINQTYRDIEIILVDDGSPDQSGKICEKYAEIDNRIRVFRTENRGLSAARNFGIKKANGQYIGFVDSDDWIEPDMYEVLLKTAQETDSDIVQCGYYEEDGLTSKKVVPIAKTYTSEEALRALLENEICSGVWSKLWKNECFFEKGFPEGHVFEDTATAHIFFSVINSVTGITRLLYHYIPRENSITNSHTISNLVDFWIAHKERYDFFSCDERFNTNSKYMNRLLYNCAMAIVRTMRWLYAVPLQDRETYRLEIEEMHEFSRKNLQKQDIKGWPLHLRFCLLLEKINKPMVLPFLYYVNQLYRMYRF